MKLRLVHNGIFPITKDKDGNPVGIKPQTGFDFPGTLQGEGKLLGVPSLFIRLAGCNLRCTWRAFDGSIDFCDTPYSSHNMEDFEEWEVDDIVATVKQNRGGINHIIISGGEPTLQNLPLSQLAKELKKIGFHITMETNGILFFPHLSKHIDLFSISPKLRSSVPDKSKMAEAKMSILEGLADQHARIRKNLESLQKYINACHIKDTYYSDVPDASLTRKSNQDFQLKFVISHEEEADEIKDEYLRHLYNWNPNDIVLMPLGSNQEFLKKTFHMTAQMAMNNNWRFTPRLHIDLFDNTQYV